MSPQTRKADDAAPRPAAPQQARGRIAGGHSETEALYHQTEFIRAR